MILIMPFAPDVGHDNDGDGHQGQPPTGGGISHGGAGQVQTDEDDDGTRDNGREEPHDLLGTHQLEQQGQHQIQQTRDHHAAQGVGQLSSPVMAANLPLSRLATAWKPPRKAKEEPRKAGTLNLVQMWNSSVPIPANSRVVWMDRGQAVARHQDGHQHRGTEHGKQVLQSQQQHPGHAQLPGVIDGVVS